MAIILPLGVYSHNNSKDKFRRELYTDIIIRVIIDAQGIRSATGELSIVTPWKNVRGLKLEADRIIIVAELMAHFTTTGTA
ncbi:MAG: hypothetical protein U5K75_08180 [Ahrensia sp.]|nr:hypothetical protein [Ahrensia sp.]